MINLTPHAITVLNVTYQPSGTIARVDMEEMIVDSFNGVPVIKRTVKGVVNVPKDTPCLVSSMVLDQLTEKQYPNVYAPDTGKTAIRNDAGQVVAVTRLVKAK